MGNDGMVAVEALVKALQAAKVSGSGVLGGGAFSVAGDCRGVVGEGADGAFAQVAALGEDVVVAYQAGLLKVRVRQSPTRVGVRAQVSNCGG